MAAKRVNRRLRRLRSLSSFARCRHATLPAPRATSLAASSHRHYRPDTTAVNCIRDASRLSPTENLKSEHDFVLPDIKRDFNKRHFVARSLFVMSESYVFVLRRGTRVCIFIDNVVRLLFMQTCAINLLTYLQNNRPTLFTPSTPRHDETSNSFVVSDLVV